MILIRTTTTVLYDLFLLNNEDIKDRYVNTSNDEYENFVNAHLEAAA